MLPVLLLGLAAQAADVELIAIEGFEGPDGRALAGEAGDWVAGYPEDTWRVYNQFAISWTDDGVEPDQVYGRRTAADNWVVTGPEVEDMHLRVRAVNQDDDFLGVVWANNRDDTWYIAGLTRDAAPPPVNQVPPNSGGRLLLYRISRESDVTLLIDQGVRFREEWTMDVWFNDGVIRVEVGDQRFDTEDGDPLGPGRVGFYAYNTGHDGGFGSTEAGFNAFFLWQLDSDDDGIVDDEDNCEDDPNPDQYDDDDDGIGNPCDPYYDGPEDTGDPVDTGDPTDPGDPGDPSLGDTPLIVGTPSCGCTTSPSLGWLGGLLALGGLLLARRRR